MISPIMASGIALQTQNVNMINHGEENRTQLNYEQTQVTVDNRRDEVHNTVISSQESDSTDTRHDARDEGKNKYFNNRNNNAKKKNPSSDGVVIKKQGGGFSVSI